MKPHEQRVIDERQELNIKWVALVAFLWSDFFKSLDTDQMNLLIEQEEVMKQYLSILDKRIALFKE